MRLVIVGCLFVLLACTACIADSDSPPTVQPAAQATSQPSDTAAHDLIAQGLAAAKTQHQLDIAIAKKELLTLIDRRTNEAIDDGDLATVQTLQAARATAAIDGTVPDDVKDVVVLVAQRNYETNIASAGARLNRAYKIAVREYTRERRFAEARATQDELDSLALVDPTMASRVVDLLQLVDPDRDTLAGRWYLEDGRLSNEHSAVAQIRFPYRPPREYDYHVVYDRDDTEWGLGLSVCRLGGAFHIGLPCQRGPGIDFHGLRALESVQYRVSGYAISHCDVCVQVRDDRLTVIINGETITDHPMTEWEFAKTPDQLVGPQRFGLGFIDWWGRTTITKAEVIQISGPGEVLGSGLPK
jgi:hypothetical protein